jgi:hypothetical protein
METALILFIVFLLFVFSIIARSTWRLGYATGYYRALLRQGRKPEIALEQTMKDVYGFVAKDE